MSRTLVATLRDLREAVGPSEDWRLKGLCAGTDDPETWFPYPNITDEVAESACDGCLVKQQCLQWSLDHKIREGTWGGMSENRRLELLRMRPIQPERYVAASP
jgi:WhiB family redox-sensing transcriptional regulator